MLRVQLYKGMQIAWSSAAAHNLSMAGVVLPALLGACRQLLLMIGTFKAILASPTWHLLCFYSLFGEAKVVNSVAGQWKNSMSLSSQVCFILHNSNETACDKLLLLLLCSQSCPFVFSGCVKRHLKCKEQRAMHKEMNLGPLVSRKF